MKLFVHVCLFTVLFLSACTSSTTSTPKQIVSDPLAAEDATTLQLTSTAFEKDGPIPEQYGCAGLDKDVSPPLTWSDPPAGTQSFALIMDDPDAPAGTWVHWVVFNIPASARGLPESFPANESLPDGTTSGHNSWLRSGYGGPCPPSGTHHYVFKLYALDEVLGIEPGATKGELEKAMVGHILAQGELIGTFTR